MINRVFLISDASSVASWSAPEQGVYHSVLAAFPLKDSLPPIYQLAAINGSSAIGRPSTVVGPSATGGLPGGFALTLDIREPLTEELLESITALLFLPAYLRIDGRPVLNWMGENTDAADSLSKYLAAQGIADPLIQRIVPEEGAVGEPVFHSAEKLAYHYRHLLQNEISFHRPLFYLGADNETVVSALTAVELAIGKDSPRSYALMQREVLLSQELSRIKKDYLSLADELRNQQEYNDILRAGAEAKDIQDYYTREYETLPLWFKRLGHVVKVLGGKRSFRSLFRDDVKKYKD